MMQMQQEAAAVYERQPQRGPNAETREAAATAAHHSEHSRAPQLVLMHPTPGGGTPLLSYCLDGSAGPQERASDPGGPSLSGGGPEATAEGIPRSAGLLEVEVAGGRLRQRIWNSPVSGGVFSGCCGQSWELGTAEGSGCCLEGPRVSQADLGGPLQDAAAVSCARGGAPAAAGVCDAAAAFSQPLLMPHAEPAAQQQQQSPVEGPPGALGASPGAPFSDGVKEGEGVLQAPATGAFFRDPVGGPRRPCLVLLDLDNTLIPTGWIMACWRKMQLYFGLQQAVAFIRRGLEEAELVGALRSLFDDLRELRERRHTQIVIVTNAGLRTVQDFYLKMCFPELRELCERERVYIHSTEHFASRVGPIPPMTEEEAFCEFYTALKYHEFDFVVQRYLNALLCQAPIPLQQGTVSQDEETLLSPSARPRLSGPLGHLEKSTALPTRRSAPPFRKRARVSAQQQEAPSKQTAGDSTHTSQTEGGFAADCSCCFQDAACLSPPQPQPASDRREDEAPSVVSTKADDGLSRPAADPPLQQQQQQQGPCCRSFSGCCCGVSVKGERKRVGDALSLREQLQVAAAASVAAEAERKDTSPAPSPSESPRGFDPFPLDWRCDLISAGDQVCEIHAACRVARHFAGHVKFAKLLFLRDPDDPRFLAQTPTRFIAQLKELHASLLHVISCDEETLDERGRPRWVRRGSFSQITIVAPQRLEAPPRHFAAARVRHAFEYLRRRRTKSRKSATLRLKQPDLGLRQQQQQQQQQAAADNSSGGDQQQVAAAAAGPSAAAAAKRHILSCPLEWERNAVANPRSSPSSLTSLRDTEVSVPFRDSLCTQVTDTGHKLPLASESRTL